MCGIAGAIHLYGPDQSWPETLRAMALTLEHRGPDDEGAWFDEDERVGLAHRRLSVVDLSSEGHQPMTSPSGRYVLVYNGEMYNFRELRSQLDKTRIRWRGHSDTEVLLAAIDEWGIERALERMTGMFAFGMWDRKEKRLYLVRDRLGEKPLYYGWQRGSFLFGSELKALAAHPAWVGSICRGSLTLFMRYGYVPTPYSIYEDVFKLPPGCMIAVDPGSSGRPAPIEYWSAKGIAESSAMPSPDSPASAIVKLEDLLSDAIGSQMVADVPVGAFLSGGVDSSVVVALMQTLAVEPVRTFTIGFKDASYDEAQNAKAVATHLRTNHTEIYVTPKEAQSVIPLLPTLYDEPLADVSQIPTYLVAKLARKSVTVSLSGDGGDELFGGYNRHSWGERIWRTAQRVPKRMRTVAAGMLQARSPAWWDTRVESLGRLVPGRSMPRTPGDKIQKMALALDSASFEELYLRLVSSWQDPTSVVLHGGEPPSKLTDNTNWPAMASYTDLMMHLDTVTYLPDNILVKVDRAAMGVSLETRIPFLDHRVVEYAMGLPLDLKLRNGKSKWLLRQVLYRHVPKQLVERPKSGFAVPIDRWLRGPLRPWAEELLDESSLRVEGYLDPTPIRRIWKEHLSGRRNWQQKLWCVLMFQAWRAEFGGESMPNLSHCEVEGVDGVPFS